MHLFDLARAGSYLEPAAGGSSYACACGFRVSHARKVFGQHLHVYRRADKRLNILSHKYVFSGAMVPGIDATFSCGRSTLALATTPLSEDRGGAAAQKYEKHTSYTSGNPVWALLSPAGVAAIAGVHMHFLHTATGVDLWGLTLSYAAGLFVGLCVVALLLRLVIRQWRLRLDGVMLLAFLLLMTAMFIPQLFSNTPPPASAIQVNGAATVTFALLTILFVAGRVLYSKQRLSARH